MEVTSIQNGIIIDHVPAGTALKVLEYLKIDPSKTRLALIMNADSHLYGTKDIIKIEDAENVDLDVLGLVARQATVGIVRGGKIVRKLKPTLPEHVVNIITCVNPRCVTTTERGIDPDAPSRAFAASGVPLRLLRRGSQVLTSRPSFRGFGRQALATETAIQAGATVFIRANPTRRCIC